VSARGSVRSLNARVKALPWAGLAEALDARGFATIPGLLDARTCREVAALYQQPARFRSRVVMARHGYGSGEYQYFGHPLPRVVSQLRAAVYPHLVPLANVWAERLRQQRRYPNTLEALAEECAAAGQTRPTPLLLKYGADDYNCLHQDLYGELAFPLQLAVLLSRPGEDFTGGEFLLAEQRPRRQSRGEVVPLDQGDAVVFAVHHRPAAGTRGYHRVNLRHGVSTVRSGQRFTLGVIFHDAR
jgi:hypothetical protein